MSDRARIAAHYDALVDRYGHDPRAVDATSAESLAVRHDALTGVAPLAGKRVLEVGCGFGDLGASILARHDGVEYRGIDVSERMIQAGRKIHPELDLGHADVLELDDVEPFDLVLAQGIFYLLGEDAETKMQRLIEKMFTLAREAVACSAISAWSDRSDPGEFRVDPVRLLAFGHTLTRSLVLRHDYHPGDVTLYLYRSVA